MYGSGLRGQLEGERRLDVRRPAGAIRGKGEAAGDSGQVIGAAPGAAVGAWQASRL